VKLFEDPVGHPVLDRAWTETESAKTVLLLAIGAGSIRARA
jgi:hypothetical protein